MRYLVTLLFLVNFIVGLCFMNEGLFHHDSVRLAQAVEMTYERRILQPALPALRARYGAVLVNSILYYPFFLFGQNADFTIRFSGVLFHSLSIVILFLFINELFADTLMAFFVSLLFSFTPFYFSPNTYGKEHSLSMFIFLLSLYLLSRGLRVRSPLLVGTASFLSAFSVSVRESMLVTTPLFFLLFLRPKISFRPFKIKLLPETYQIKFISAAVLPFLSLLCILFVAYLFQEAYGAIFIVSSASSNFMGLFSPVLAMAFKDLFISTPLLVFSFFILGIIKMIRDKKIFLERFFIIWFLLIFYLGNTSCYCPRYLDIVAIPIYVFAAYFVSTFFYRKNRLLALGIIVFCLLDILFFMNRMLVYRHFYNGPKQFALYLKERTEPQAVVIAIDEGPFIEYYGKRKVIYPYVGGEKEEINKFIKIVEGYLINNTPVYIITSTFVYDRNNTLKNGLLKNFELVLVGEKLTEDYHRPELGFRFFNEELFKVSFKSKGAK